MLSSQFLGDNQLQFNTEEQLSILTTSQMQGVGDGKLQKKFRHVSQPSTLHNFYGPTKDSSQHQDQDSNPNGQQTSRNSARMSLLIKNFEEVLDDQDAGQLRKKTTQEDQAKYLNRKSCEHRQRDNIYVEETMSELSSEFMEIETL